MIGIDLTGKVAIVTGAGTGLGRATATLLHRAGARVVINYFNDSAGVNGGHAGSLLAELGDRAVAFAADVRDTAAVDAMFDHAAATFGAVDIVVNNAGILRDRTLAKMSDAEWQAVIDTNLTGVFHVCRAAARTLAPGGSVVNISSISGFNGAFGQGNYAAAKAGIIGLTRSLAHELARRHIRVNAVAPGLIDTDMSRTIPKQYLDEMVQKVPLARMGDPDDIAGAVLFLCSSLAKYITGQTLHVNGGWWLA
jgi:3-oxoacyl-[acyl-carrier protein] reductase